MADRAVFEIIVTDKGLKINQKKVEELGASVERTTKRTKEAGKASEELNYKLNQGTVGASSAARSFSKLSQAIGEGPNGLVGAYATLAANAFAVSAAFNVLRSAAQAEQVMKGLEVQGARTGQALTVTAKRVQELSGYTLSLGDAMQATAQASASGFDTKTIERLTKTASDASAALGRNMPDSMDRLVKGLSKMEPELLDELGAMTKLTEASKAYALQNGKTEASLSTLEKRTAFSNAILTELELKFGGIAEESGSVARSYDRLAAAFQDVTKNGLNLISGILAPLIEFLASNKAALLGVGVAFLSTIRGQIVPGISELASVQANAAKAQSEASKKDIDSINKLGSGKRKAYNDLVESIKAGTQTEAQYNAASIEMADKKKAILEKVYRDQEKGEKLRAAQLSKIEESEVALSKAQSAGAKARREQAVASGISATEDMNAFNAVGKLGAALGETREALRANSEAKKLAGKEATGLSANMAHLGAQARITGTIMGTALLNALPAIGQVILAISVLIQIFDSLKSSQRKALESAVSNLDEVIKNAANTVKELARIESSQGSLSARTEKDLIARSNAVSNLASSYKDVIKAATDAQNAEKGTATGVAGILDSLIGGEKGNRSYFLNIRQDSKVLTEALKKDAQESGDFFGANINSLKTTQQLLNTESVKTLDALSKLVPKETFERVIELNGGLSKIIGNSKLTGKVIEELGKRQGSTAQVTKDLTQSFKSADEALSEFLKSAVIKTPYDNVVKSLESVTKALIDMTLAVPDSTQWAGLLTGIGPELEKMLNSQNRQTIQQARASDIVIQNLRSQKDLTGSLTIEQENQLNAEQNKLKTLNAQLPNIIANIEQEKARFIQAQATTREMQAQIGVIQAIMSKNQLAYTAGAAGEIARINREEQIRNIQISSLELQKNILESSLDQVQATLTQLEAQRKLNKEISLQSSAVSVNTAQQNLEAALLQARGLKVPEKFITTTVSQGVEKFSAVPKGSITEDQLAARNLVVSRTQALNARKQELETDRQIVSTKAEERDILATINSLESQIEALREQNLTSAQKAAKAAEAEQQSKNEILNLTATKENQERTNLALTNKRLRIEQGINSAIADQVSSLGTDYANQLNTLETQSKAQNDSLIKSINTVNEMKKTATGDELKAYASLELKLNNQLKLNQEISKLKKEELKTQSDISILELIDLNTAEKKLQLLQKTIEFYQKEASQRETILDKEAELYALRLKNSRGGRPIGEAAQKAIDFKAAQAQIEAAKEQLELKKLGINLEYALLEAQKALLVEELKLKKIESDKISKDSTKSPEVRAAASNISEVLGTSINTLASQSYNALRDNAIRIAELDVKILEEKATEAYNNIIGSFLNTVLGQNNPAFSLLNALDETALIIKNLKEGKGIREATTRMSPEAKAQVEATAANTNASIDQISAINNLILGLAQNTSAITAQTTAISTESTKPPAPATPPATPTEPIVDKILTKLQPWQSPFPQRSGFGERTHPVTGKRRMHHGRDFAYPEGTPIRAQEAGVVGFVGSLGGYGNVIDLYVGEMENGVKVFRRFAHLMDSAVKAGDRLEPGDLLGRTGSTGLSTGPHLHEEVRVGRAGAGVAMNPLDRPSIRGYGETATTSTENEDIVVTGAKTTTKSVRTEAKMWSDIIKNARAEIAGTADDIKLNFVESLAAISPTINNMTEQLKTLGPQGEAAAAIGQGIMTIATSFGTTMQTIGESYKEYSDGMMKKFMEDGEITTKEIASMQSQAEHTAGKMAAVFSAASAAIGAVSSMLQANSQARIANIDKEIAAEQKRDGKSAASVAKIEAMEKKKDSIARKQFNTNKKLQLAQAVMSTAAGIAGVLSQTAVYGPILTPILAGMIGAMGLAQIAIISGTSYESTAGAKAVSTPSALSIGKRSDSVNLAAGPNANAGGEVGFLRGAQGTGSNASNFRTIGSAYGGELMRGYGNRGFVVGEKGPEVITPETPITVTPADSTSQAQSINASFNIQALDASGVQDILVSQKGNIIKMLREASNASGKSFMEDVNVNVYTRPSIGKL